MNSTKFSLIPATVATVPPIEVIGVVKRDLEWLHIQYQLTGKLSEIKMASPNSKPNRKYDLWETTCCEFFVRPYDQSQYWEFNLAPSGDWNIFRFPDYRQDIAEELAYNALKFEVWRSPELFQLDLAVDLSPIIHPQQNLDLAISAVIESRKQLSYWALTHPATEADFHHQESFAIALTSG